VAQKFFDEKLSALKKHDCASMLGGSNDVFNVASKFNGAQ